MENTISPGPRYNRVAIGLHWIIAAMIVTNFVLVWTAEEVSEDLEHYLVGLHAAIGILVLIFSVARIIWRVTHPAPPYAPSLKSWEVALARVTHALFYFLIIGIPFTGWAMVSIYSGGGSVDMFGLFDFPKIPFTKNEPAAGDLHEVHELLGTLMLGLLALHVVAALKHQFIDKDETLSRMIPWLRR